MTTLILGFVGLVIIPAFILAEVLTRLTKEPSESTDPGKGNSFTLFSSRKRSGNSSGFAQK